MALTTITNSMVSVNAIQGTLIADNAITAVHIATNAVSGTLIADNAITATHIAQNIITVTQLADDAVEGAKIADGVITTNHLNKAMISSQTEVAVATGDYVLLGDTSDSNNLKKAPISSILAGTLTTAAQTNITSVGTLSSLAVGAITSTAASTITTADNLAQLTLISTDADANVGPVLKLFRNSGSPADDDAIGRIQWSADDDAGNDSTFARINVVATDVSNGSEDARMEFAPAVADSFTPTMSLTGGNVGIGGNDPKQALEIIRNSSSGSAGGYAGLSLRNDHSSGLMAVQFHEGQTNVCDILVQNGVDDMQFRMGGSEKMRITSSGNVGIGTSAPSRNLSIVSASYYSLELQGSNAYNNLVDTGIVFSAKYNSAGAVTDIGSIRGGRFSTADGNYAGVLKFFTRPNGGSDTERMRVSYQGNVGIGENDPQELLHLTATTPVFRLEGGSRSYQQFVDSTSFYIRDVTAGANRVTLDSSGRLLVGHTSAGTNGALQVTGGIGLKGNSEIRSSTNSDDGSTIKFFGTQMVAGSNSHTYGYSEGGYIASLATAGGAILLDVGNTTANTGHRFRVVNAGNGVDGSIQYISGTTSRLHVDSATGSFFVGATAAVDSERAAISKEGTCKLLIHCTENSSARDAVLSLHTYNGGSQNRIYFLDGAGAGSGQGQFYYNHDGNTMYWITGATENMTLDSSGNLTIQGSYSPSDGRLKENIEDFSYDIEKFKAYSPKTFDWINPEEHGGRTQQIGFIAQEQEVIDPRFIEEVETDADRKDTLLLDQITKLDGDVKGISKTSEFVQKDAMYVSVIQQLITRLETAEAKIAVLEG